MEHRSLGEIGLRVSMLGYGASAWAGSSSRSTSPTGIRAVRTALALGVRIVGLPPYYGGTVAETVLGRAGTRAQRHLAERPVGTTPRRPGVQRYGSVIRLRPDKREEYLRLHADVWSEVEDTLVAANIRNYSIFLHGDLLFGYYEYIGEDHVADQATIAADPSTRRWWAPMAEVWHLSGKATS